MYLVEAMDDYVLHVSGWRAGGAQIVGVINTSFVDVPAVERIRYVGNTAEDVEGHFKVSISPVALSIQAACDKYRVPLLDYSDALEMAKIVWSREGMAWPL
jgi:hypothetical protein